MMARAVLDEVRTGIERTMREIDERLVGSQGDESPGPALPFFATDTTAAEAAVRLVGLELGLALCVGAATERATLRAAVESRAIPSPALRRVHDALDAIDLEDGRLFPDALRDMLRENGGPYTRLDDVRRELWPWAPVHAFAVFDCGAWRAWAELLATRDISRGVGARLDVAGDLDALDELVKGLQADIAAARARGVAE